MEIAYCRKRNRPLRLLQQYAPVVAGLELLLLLIVILTYQSSVKYGNSKNLVLQQKTEAQAAENRNLMVTILIPIPR